MTRPVLIRSATMRMMRIIRPLPCIRARADVDGVSGSGDDDLGLVCLKTQSV